MSSSIGSASLKLGTQDAGFTDGLKKADQGVSGWAVGITGSIGMVGNSFVGLVGALGLKGLTLSFQEFGAQVSQQFEEVDNAAKAAARAGTDIDSLLGLQHAAELAGSNGQAINSALDRLNRKTAEMAGGNQSATETFRQLGISQDELAGLDAVQRMHLVADGLAGIEDAAQRTLLAQQLFGKSGAELLPTLTQGGAALREQAAEYERLAGRIGSGGARAIEEANDAATRAETAWTGIIRWVTVQLAPVKELVSIIVTELLVGFRQMLPAGEGFGDTVLNVFEAIAVALGTFIDMAKLAGASFITDFLTPMIRGVADMMLRAAPLAEVLGDGMSIRVQNAAGALDGLAFNLRQTGRAMQESSAAGAEWEAFLGSIDPDEAAFLRSEFGSGTTAGSMGAFFSGVREQWNNRHDEFEQLLATMDADEAEFWRRMMRTEAEQAAALAREQQEGAVAAAEAIGKLQDQIANVGMTQGQQQIRQLREAGAGEDAIAQVQGLQEQLAQMQEAEKLINQFRSPADVMAERLNQLSLMWADGAISTEVYNQAVNEAIRTAERASGMGEIKLASAAVDGSKEAVNAIMRHQIQGTGASSPQDRILRVQEAQRQIQQQMRDGINAIVRHVNPEQQPAV